MRAIVGLFIFISALQAHAISLRCQSDKAILTEGESVVNEVVVYRIDSSDPSIVASNLSSTVDMFSNEGSATVNVSFSNQCDNEYSVSFETVEIQKLAAGEKSQINGLASFDWIGKVDGEEKANLTCQLISDSQAALELGIK